MLSPEELLYRCVHFINHTHDKAGAGMDVKLRSLVCLGLNEQASGDIPRRRGESLNCRSLDPIPLSAPRFGALLPKRK